VWSLVCGNHRLLRGSTFYTPFTDGGGAGTQAGGVMKTLLIPTLLFVAAAFSAAIAKEPATAAADKPPLVQIALLLDTSNSMDGLIEQAKSQLWKIVNEFDGAKRNGKPTVVQVALYEYGNNNLSAGTNYIRRVLPFTDELDLVAEQLFKLTTHGGEEYCGAVIREAIDSLAWDSHPLTYRTLFVAGNEPFTQGAIDATESCRLANQRGIVVNTIHCGSRALGEKGGWRMGAALADGRFLIIDQDKAVAHIDAPQDQEIERLSLELNRTYIQYGAKGAIGVANAEAQDSNANAYKSSGANVQRGITKSSSIYNNGSWELVDANKRNGVKLESLPETDLPEEMRKLKPEERQAYVDQKHAERQRIQAEIQRLNAERQKFLAAKAKEQGQNDTLDQAIAGTVREQAAKVKIEFK
jgi:hypothetical protein